jgi:hypothetical protein
MSNIVKFPTPSQQGCEADDAERVEASFAEKRLATIARIEAGIEMRNRAFREGLDHLSRNRVTDFLDALKDGRIDDATEIFDGGAGLAAQFGEPDACDIDTAPTLAKIIRFDARPKPLHSVESRVALPCDNLVTSANGCRLEVEQGRIELVTGQTACLSAGYASVTLLLHRGTLSIEIGQETVSCGTAPQSCVAIQIEAAAGCLGELVLQQVGEEPVIGFWIAARYPDSRAECERFRFRISQPIVTDPSVCAEAARGSLERHLSTATYPHRAAEAAGDFVRFDLRFDCADEKFDCQLLLLASAEKPAGGSSALLSAAPYELPSHPGGLEVIAMLRGGLWAQFTDYEQPDGEEGHEPLSIPRDPELFAIPSACRHESQLVTASVVNGTFRSDVVIFDPKIGHHIAMADGVPSFGLHLSFSSPPSKRSIKSPVREAERAGHFSGKSA